MPVEIRELVIKAVVDEEKPDSVTAGNEKGSPQQEVIIQACIEKLLEILKDKNER